MHIRVCLPNAKTKTYPLSFLLRYILFNGIYVFHCDVDVAFNFAGKMYILGQTSHYGIEAILI